MPWESHAKHLPKIEPKGKKNITSLYRKLYVNKTTTFRGRVHEGANQFIISLENAERENFKYLIF